MTTVSYSVPIPPSESVAVAKHSTSSFGERLVSKDRSNVADSVAVVVEVYTSPVVRLDQEKSNVGVSPSLS